MQASYCVLFTCSDTTRVTDCNHSPTTAIAESGYQTKWWKHARASSLPIRSFYVDMVLSVNDTCTGAKTYGQCLYEFFTVLSNSRCGALPDPCRISGNIAATNTETQRQQLLTSVEYALAHSRAALIAQQRQDSREANRQWDIVFNGYL